MTEMGKAKKRKREAAAAKRPAMVRVQNVRRNVNKLLEELTCPVIKAMHTKFTPDKKRTKKGTKKSGKNSARAVSSGVRARCTPLGPTRAEYGKM